MEDIPLIEAAAPLQLRPKPNRIDTAVRNPSVFRLDAVLDSDFRGTGPLEGGIASVRGLGAREALAYRGGRSFAAASETQPYRYRCTESVGLYKWDTFLGSGHSGPASCA
jgi:hypothetical protein